MGSRGRRWFWTDVFSYESVAGLRKLGIIYSYPYCGRFGLWRYRSYSRLFEVGGWNLLILF